MKTDVLIVGAGPTGLALAAQLIRYGVEFIIVDKNETTTPHSKAIGVQARTLEIYEQIGLSDQLVQFGTIAERAVIIESGEARGEIFLKQFGEGMSPYPFLLLVEQGKHEGLLYDYIRSYEKDVMWQMELENFSQNESGVSANLKNSSGEKVFVEAKFLIGCDGAKSFVRNALALEFEGGTLERLFYVADVEIDWNFSHEALYACLAKNSVTAFFPMTGSEKNFRIVGTFPEGHDKEPNDILYEEIERQIVADTELALDITEVNWFSVYKVHSRAVNKFSEGRCFLAGDSAHIHTPAGAQGMNTGIQDGYNLAWKMAMVLNGNADARLLDTYNEERQPNARRLIQTTDRFFQLGASDDWFVSFFRTQIFPYIANIALNLDVVRSAVFPLVSQIGINYRGSSLSRDGGGFNVKAGERMPWFMIEGQSIYDRLREPSFHLVVFDDGRAGIPRSANVFEGLVDVHVVPLYPHITETFGVSKTFSVLLRPDNYIGYIAEGYGAESVKKYLDSVLQ